MGNVSCHNLTFKKGEEDEIIKYSPNPEHRNNNPQKSQWTISENEEIECFWIAYDKGWEKENSVWGLYFEQDRVVCLGLGEDRSVELFIARFRNDVPHNTWHGYPADYKRRQHDVPDRGILRDWVQRKIINKAQERKITLCQPCRL